jgi:hypothetical protein
MVIKKFIIRIFMGVYRRSIAGREKSSKIIGPAAKHAGHHIGMVPESYIGKKN